MNTSRTLSSNLNTAIRTRMRLNRQQRRPKLHLCVFGALMLFIAGVSAMEKMFDLTGNKRHHKTRNIRRGSVSRTGRRKRAGKPAKVDESLKTFAQHFYSMEVKARLGTYGFTRSAMISYIEAAREKSNDLRRHQVVIERLNMRDGKGRFPNENVRIALRALSLAMTQSSDQKVQRNTKRLATNNEVGIDATVVWKQFTELLQRLMKHSPNKDVDSQPLTQNLSGLHEEYKSKGRKDGTQLELVNFLKRKRNSGNKQGTTVSADSCLEDALPQFNKGSQFMSNLGSIAEAEVVVEHTESPKPHALTPCIQRQGELIERLRKQLCSSGYSTSQNPQLDKMMEEYDALMQDGSHTEIASKQMYLVNLLNRQISLQSCAPLDEEEVSNHDTQQDGETEFDYNILEEIKRLEREVQEKERNVNEIKDDLGFTTEKLDDKLQFIEKVEGMSSAAATRPRSESDCESVASAGKSVRSTPAFGSPCTSENGDDPAYAY